MNLMVDFSKEIKSAKGETFRSMIFDVEKQVSEMPEVDTPTFHHFAKGSYAREFHLPAGAVVVGKIHKHEHPVVLSAGTVTVADEFGHETFSAPRTWISKAGVKRLVYAHEDAVFTTFHVTDSTDLEEIEKEVIAKDYAELEAFLCLGEQ